MGKGKLEQTNTKRRNLKKALFRKRGSEPSVETGKRKGSVGMGRIFSKKTNKIIRKTMKRKDEAAGVR